MKKRIIGGLAALAVIFSLLCLPVSAAEESRPMSTDSYQVDVTVSENHTYEICERIQVDFHKPRHGIYRYIPYLFDITHEVDGQSQTDSCRVRIQNISVTGGALDTSYKNGNVVLRIGDEDKTLLGKQTYVIRYTVRNRADGIDSFDEFYWNLIPHNWETDISSAKISVTFPKKADLSKARVLCGSYGSLDTNRFQVSENGTTLIATAKGALSKGEGVTLRAQLPNMYFSGEEENAGLQFLMIALMVLCFAGTIVLKILLGRSKTVIPVIGFYPPEGMTSADVGFVLDGMTDTKDILSLIIYWAHRGLLSIEEIDDKTMRLTRLAPLPEDAKAYEKAMFDQLFFKRDTVTTAELKNHFYTAIAAAKKGVRTHYTAQRETRIFKKSSVVAGFFAMLLTALPMALFLCIGYEIRIVDEGVLIGGIFFGALTLGLLLFLNMVEHRKNAVTRGKYYTQKILAWAGIIVVALCGALVGATSLHMTRLAVVAAVMTLAQTTMVVRMRCYTDYGTRLIGEILGFREFIRTAELDRLKALANNDPAYFYGVLPFAYVMGLSDVWAKKFKEIAVEPPQWYIGQGGADMFNTWLFMNSFRQGMDTLGHSMISTPAQQASGSSGGFSGGGFSGGGGGGGGGGSW